jgi:hypothetical protein
VSRNLKLDESQKDLNFDPNQKKTCESQKWSIPWTHNIGFHFAQFETSWES